MVMKIFCEIAIKKDSGNSVISLLSSANVRFHCGKNILWKVWNVEVKSSIVISNNTVIIQRENIDQRNNHFKISLYLDEKIKNNAIPANKVEDIKNK